MPGFLPTLFAVSSFPEPQFAHRILELGKPWSELRTVGSPPEGAGKHLRN